MSNLIKESSSLNINLAKVLASSVFPTPVGPTKRKDPRKINVNRMKIISELHIETIHLLIPNGYQPKKQNMEGLFSKFKTMFLTNNNKPIKISLQMLKDQEIASWGGSSVSAKALSYFFGLNWKIKEIPEQKRDSINNMPILLVGGQPYEPVKKYLATGKYKLVGLNYSEISAKAPFYISTEASYHIDGKSISAPSIGIQALIIGKAFRKESRNKAMTNLAQCINDNLPDLADDPDTNPNWNSVYDLNEEGQQINWSYFPIK